MRMLKVRPNRSTALGLSLFLLAAPAYAQTTDPGQDIPMPSVPAGVPFGPTNSVKVQRAAVPADIVQGAPDPSPSAPALSPAKVPGPGVPGEVYQDNGVPNIFLPEPNLEGLDTDTRMVNHFTVEGSNLVKDEDLRKILKAYEGKKLTLDQMKAAARDVTALYQRNGYYLVKAVVPTQDFNTGTIRIHVVEGKIGTVTVEGARHYDPKFIKRRFLRSIVNGNFKREEFTRAMLLLNEQPDLKVQAVLRPGKEPGTADVVLKADDENTLHFGIDYNNYGTYQTGQNRVGLNMDAGNLISQTDLFSLRGVLGFPSSAGTDFFQAQYQTPVSDNGDVLSAAYANGAFTVSQGLGAILDIRGSANIYTLGFSHPLDRELDFSSNLGLVVSYKDVRNDFFGGAEPFSRDRYTMSRLTYQADWRGSSGRTILQASWSQGLGGNSSETDPFTSRVGAGGTFAHFNFDIGRIQNLTDGLYGMIRASGQVATAPLYVTEQMAVGGPDTVRGYPQAALLGDNGYVVSGELRWSPIKKVKDKFQTVFFIDHGGVSDNHKLPGDLPYGNNITGTGVGLRYSFSSESNIRVDVGFPLTNTNLERGPAVYTGLQTRF